MSNPNPPGAWKKGIKSPNPKGRPSSGKSLTELMKEHLEKIPEGSEVSYKEAFISKVFARAIEGNDTYVKLVWNYVDGMPKQSTDITSGGEKLRMAITEVAAHMEQENDENKA